MPPRSKRTKPIKRKKGTANHQTPTNSSGGPQGNGPVAIHDDSNDHHPFTDEDFSPSSSMEAPPEPAVIGIIEQQTVSESEQTEVAAELPLEVLEESSGPVEVWEKSGEGGSYGERTEIPAAIPRAGPPPLLERRASWWNCCGFLDVFGNREGEIEQTGF